jgi:hypothetical protein
MEARLVCLALISAAACSLGASHRTQNFVSTAPTQQLAVEIGEAAEKYRRDLALEWLGAELPPWGSPCPITSQVGPHLGAGGATSFMFDQGRPFGWTMSIQGSRERLLDSVLPHEVTHTIFATHFGRPLPRWADEGACTTVEHASEKSKQQQMLIQFLTTNRGIAFNKMFAMKEYPHDVMPLYSQGYSLVRYLIAQGGKRKFVAYVGDGMRTNNWTAATDKHYGYKSLSELQVTWLEWVRGGSREIQPKDQLASQPAAPVTEIAATPLPRAKSEGVVSSRDGLVPVMPIADSAPKPRTSIAGSPRATDVAQGSLAQGWYAKQRDRALAQQREGGSMERARPAQDDSRSQPQVLTRPQPIGRPGQGLPLGPR